MKNIIDIYVDNVYPVLTIILVAAAINYILSGEYTAALNEFVAAYFCGTCGFYHYNYITKRRK